MAEEDGSDDEGDWHDSHLAHQQHQYGQQHPSARAPPPPHHYGGHHAHPAHLSHHHSERSGEMSALATLASDELHEIERVERERDGAPHHHSGYHSHQQSYGHAPPPPPPGHAYAPAHAYQHYPDAPGPHPYAAPPSAAHGGAPSASYYGAAPRSVKSSAHGASTPERPPGCTHDDCHRDYNQKVAAALEPLHHHAEGRMPPPPPASHAASGAHPYAPPSSYGTYEHASRYPAQPYGGPHFSRHLASNPSSMPSSREHSPRYSPHDSNMSEEYGSDGEHVDDHGRHRSGYKVGAVGHPAPLMLPQPRLAAPGPPLAGPVSYPSAPVPEWTPSSSPVLGPLKSMSLFSHTVPNTPYGSRPGSPVRGHRHSPPDARSGFAVGSPPHAALHVAGQGHHVSHRHRSHPYSASSGTGLAESRSHHHLSSLGAPTTSAARATIRRGPSSSGGERSTADPDSNESTPAVSSATSPMLSNGRPPLSRSNSNSFGGGAKSTSSLSLSAYHLTGPTSDQARRLVKEHGPPGGSRNASESFAGTRSANASRTHLPSLAADGSSRTLPSLFPDNGRPSGGNSHHAQPHLHSVANGHHQPTHTHNFHPYGTHGASNSSKRSKSRSAPASRATSPHTSPSMAFSAAHPMPVSHSRQDSHGQGGALAASPREQAPSAGSSPQHGSGYPSLGQGLLNGRRSSQHSSPSSSFTGGPSSMMMHHPQSRQSSPATSASGQGSGGRGSVGSISLPSMAGGRGHSTTSGYSANGSGGNGGVGGASGGNGTQSGSNGSKKSLFALTPIHASAPHSPSHVEAKTASPALVHATSGMTLPPISSLNGGGGARQEEDVDM